MNLSDLQTVFVAEFLRRVRSRAFLIGMLIGVVGILLMAKVPALVGHAFSGSSTIVVVGEPALSNRASDLLKNDYDIAAQLPSGTRVTPALLKREKAAAAFEIAATTRGIALHIEARDPSSMNRKRIARDLLPLQLELATKASAARVSSISKIPIALTTVGSKFTSSDQAEAVKGIAYVLIFFLYFLILLNSQLVTSSIAEEKTSRIAELLVACVEPTTLLAGKILAGTAIAVIQMIAWLAVGALAGGPSQPTSVDPSNIFSLASIFDVLTPLVVASFFVFFVIGLFQLSTVFAALASLVNRTEDLGSITGPLTVPVVVALFVAIAALGSPDAPWAVVLSYVPIVSPFVMFARIAVSTIPPWQVALAIAINLAALYAICIAAGKLYRVGMLLYGRPPKLSQVWNVIRS